GGAGRHDAARRLPHVRRGRRIGAGGGARRPVHPGCSNAGLEAFNNGIKVAIRMAYGFHHVTNLIGLVMLRCGGLDIRLPQPAI
ncbi:transposase, partial [Bifidobacterium longum]|uniref:transposase n=1 Tax=Bifidobacterium longum TaxID=216816 RepID=UPI00299035B7